MGYLFNSAACFAGVRESKQFYTNGYCVGNILVQLAAIIALAYISVLFAWHMKRKGWGRSKTWTRPKTWIFILLLIFELMVVLRYTFNMYGLSIYVLLISFGQMVGSITFFLICFFFTTKASMYLDNRAGTLFILKVFGLFCLLVFVITFIL